MSWTLPAPVAPGTPWLVTASLQPLLCVPCHAGHSCPGLRGPQPPPETRPPGGMGCVLRRRVPGMLGRPCGAGGGCTPVCSPSRALWPSACHGERCRTRACAGASGSDHSTLSSTLGWTDHTCPGPNLRLCSASGPSPPQPHPWGPHRPPPWWDRSRWALGLPAAPPALPPRPSQVSGILPHMALMAHWAQASSSQVRRSGVGTGHCQAPVLGIPPSALRVSTPTTDSRWAVPRGHLRRGEDCRQAGEVAAAAWS